jgi:predicted small lipoprotein YifL
MKRLLLCLAGALPLTLVLGCGQKGGLYLPPRNGTVVTRPAGAAGTPPQTTNQTSPRDTTTLPSTIPSETTPSGTLKQEPGPATQSTGGKQPTDKDKDSATQQTPKTP